MTGYKWQIMRFSGADMDIWGRGQTWSSKWFFQHSTTWPSW